MYTNFFELSEKPFELTPDPKFLYQSAGLKEVLATMLYGVRERRGFIVLVGEPGTGKTTLLNSCIDRLDSLTKVAFLFNMGMNFGELLHMALVDLELASIDEEMSKSKAIQLLNHFAIKQFEEGGNVVIILDEAQNLSPHNLESLRQLSNLETRKHKLIQIVLSGQPELENVLSIPKLRQLAQRIALRCRTSMLTEKETYEYIQHRLHKADYRGPSIFSNKAKYAIWEYSKGIPRLINVLCDGSLLIAYGLERKRIDSGIVNEVIKDLYEVPMGASNDGAADSVAEFLDSLTDTVSEDEKYSEPFEEEKNVYEPQTEAPHDPANEIYGDSRDVSNANHQDSLTALEEFSDQPYEKRESRRKSIITVAFVVIIFLAALLYFFKNDGGRSNDYFAVFSAKTQDASVFHGTSLDSAKPKMRSKPDTDLDKKNTASQDKHNKSKPIETQPVTRTPVKPDQPQANSDSSEKKSSQSASATNGELQGQAQKPIQTKTNIKKVENLKPSMDEKVTLDTSTGQAKLPETKDTDLEPSAMHSSLYGSSLYADSAEDEIVDKENTMMVKRGESLVEIIIKVYGKYSEQILRAVLSANPEIQNPNLIFENQIIKLPRDIEKN